MKKGGMTKKYKEGGMMDKKDIKQDKAMAKKAVGMHEKQLHGGKKSDLAALKKGGRIASKGEHAVQKHSKRGAEMVKMKSGGCAKMAKGGGIEVRGKTKGKICQENNMAEKIPTVDEIYDALMPKKDDPRLKVIKKGDMSKETKALPDEVVKPPKGIGKSEDDMEPRKYKKGGSVKSSASKRADGCATKGKTKGRII